MNELNGIKSERKRSNILKRSEAISLVYLCKNMPSWVKPDILTLVGLLGSIIVFGSLIMALFSKYFLLLGVLGFAIQWFGDSLDGRLAYYRNIPRKWYGWSLDLNVDWISTCIIGLGFYLYFSEFKIFAFLFVIAYGGSIILTLMRYKISDNYEIDSLFFGPTELRIIISLFLVVEIFIPGSLEAFGLIGSILLIAINFYQSIQIINQGDLRDKKEKLEKSLQGAH